MFYAFDPSFHVTIVQHRQIHLQIVNQYLPLVLHILGSWEKLERNQLERETLNWIKSLSYFLQSGTGANHSATVLGNLNFHLSYLEFDLNHLFESRAEWHQASESLHRSSPTSLGATTKLRIGTGRRKNSELHTINQDSERIATPLLHSKLLRLQMCAIQQQDWKYDIMFMNYAGNVFSYVCVCVCVECNMYLEHLQILCFYCISISIGLQEKWKSLWPSFSYSSTIFCTTCSLQCYRVGETLFWNGISKQEVHKLHHKGLVGEIQHYIWLFLSVFSGMDGFQQCQAKTRGTSC